MSLEESIWVIARARLFLGVCSGMSHVAHSVGVPTIVIEYRQPVGPWQPAESERFQIAWGTDEAMRMVHHLMTSYQGLHAEYAKPFQPGPRPLEAWTQAEITGRFPKGST